MLYRLYVIYYKSTTTLWIENTPTWVWPKKKVSGFWSSVGFKIGAVTRFFIYLFIIIILCV